MKKKLLKFIIFISISVFAKILLNTTKDCTKENDSIIENGKECCPGLQIKLGPQGTFGGGLKCEKKWSYPF